MGRGTWETVGDGETVSQFTVSEKRTDIIKIWNLKLGRGIVSERNGSESCLKH